MEVTTAKKTVYHPDQEGLIFPKEPSFDNAREEQAHRKKHLAIACRVFARMGYSLGFGGHLTVRDPIDPHTYWTNPFCVPFSMVKVSNLVRANHRGEVLEGDYAINRAGFVLHSAIHADNPDIIASCHAHTVPGSAWSAMGRPLDPTCQDACIFYGDHIVVQDGAGKLPTDDDSGVGIAEAFRHNKAVIHQNHGLLTASRHSIDDAVWYFIALNHACHVQLMTEACRSAPVLVTPEFARITQERAGNPIIGWLHFQTYVMEVLHKEPDVLG
jgi:ribulose-5-phosphate 4-epimerase/fuculose-1-phosphate aldolase